MIALSRSIQLNHSCLIHVYLYKFILVQLRKFKFLAVESNFERVTFGYWEMSQLLCGNECWAWANGTSSSRTCTVEKKLTKALSLCFGFTSFRSGQLEALLPVANGKDTFVHMPTGGGKSLCMFSMPLTVSSAAMGVVLSPLVGLIEQQVSWY